jgi:membrane-bound lytic murein transglycosylase A
MLTDRAYAIRPYVLAFFTLLILISCAEVKPVVVKPAPLPRSADTMVMIEPDNYPQFELGDSHTLKEAINQDLKYLNRQPNLKEFKYGRDVYTAEAVKESLIEFLTLLDQFSDNNEEFNKEIKKRFNVYRSTGSDGVGKTLFTGYYVPEINGSLQKDDTYRYPIYTVPKDLIPIDLGLFSSKFKGKTILARIADGKIQPYYTHQEIFEGALDDLGLELIWVDDRIKLFFMQIQGSGVIKLQDGSVYYLGYAGSNGHIYKSIGKYLADKDHVKLEDISMQSIIAYLNGHPEEIDNALFYNPSYVFFKKTKDMIVGSLGVQLVPIRSIASDSKVFPRGGLAYIMTTKPQCNEKGEITGWDNLSQFVLNQDTGGAIKGAGRVDIFWGTGDYAEAAAGNLKHLGNLYFLIKK